MQRIFLLWYSLSNLIKAISCHQAKLFAPNQRKYHKIVLCFLQIAKILLHNAKAWQKVSGKRPIFVVCYTNHALDQFLEGIHAFHEGVIVRVGGRSQSETMKECSLFKWKCKLRVRCRLVY